MRSLTHGAAGSVAASYRDRETDAAGAFSTTLSALSAISSSTQCNTCNAMKAKYWRSGQWHGWNLWRDMTCVKLEACFGPCVACISLAYGAVCRLQRRRTSRYDARCLTCLRLETGLYSLLGLWRNVHHPARCPSATTPVTYCHCPPALFPTTTLYYVTSLDHCQICRAITAGGVVKRCANCSPSNHARRDFLCRCLARHVGDNITD